MAIGGRKPKPTALKLAHGNPSHRPISKREPKPAKGKPKCPAYLSAAAKLTWTKLCSDLDSMGLLHVTDSQAIARYCDIMEQWHMARLAIREVGGFAMDILDNEGRVKYRQQLPEVGIYQRLATHLLRLEQEFGLTPAARTRIETVGSAGGADPIGELMAAAVRRRRSG